MIHDHQTDLITAVHAEANDEDDRANTAHSALKLYLNACKSHIKLLYLEQSECVFRPTPPQAMILA